MITSKSAFLRENSPQNMNLILLLKLICLLLTFCRARGAQRSSYFDTFAATDFYRSWSLFTFSKPQLKKWTQRESKQLVLTLEIVLCYFSVYFCLLTTFMSPFRQAEKGLKCSKMFNIQRK